MPSMKEWYDNLKRQGDAEVEPQRKKRKKSNGKPKEAEPESQQIAEGCNPSSFPHRSRNPRRPHGGTSPHQNAEARVLDD